MKFGPWIMIFGQEKRQYNVYSYAKFSLTEIGKSRFLDDFMNCTAGLNYSYMDNDKAILPGGSFGVWTAVSI